MSFATVPLSVKKLPLGDRVRWARKRAGLSHDRLIERLGRSNRSHLIKIEQGKHLPGRELRDAIADACGVSRDLFADEDDEESDPVAALMNAIRILVRDEVARGAVT